MTEENATGPDMTGEIDGKPVLIDVKTTGRVPDCGDPTCGCASRPPWFDDLDRKCAECGKKRDDVRWGKCAECRGAA